MGLGATTLGWASWYFLPSVLVEGKGLPPEVSATAGGRRRELGGSAQHVLRLPPESVMAA